MGDWSGWADREFRLLNPSESVARLDRFHRLRWSDPAWDGGNLAGKTILAFADGGFGDCLMTLRYVPALVREADAVILAVRPECVSLVQHNFGDSVTVLFRELAPSSTAFDCYTFFMSLPALIRTIPSFVALSAPKPVGRTATSARRLRIGLCWAGKTHNPERGSGRFSSLCLDHVRRLLSRSDVEWHSLQTGMWASDADAYPKIMQSSAPLYTFAETANLIAGLDCVVTVDTAVAHLAGALGVPTFVLLQFKAEFRWGSGRTTPWYPSVRLIRQPAPGDWPSVVDAVMATLDEGSWPDFRRVLAGR
jgi:hypothetical protein